MLYFSCLNLRILMNREKSPLVIYSPYFFYLAVLDIFAPFALLIAFLMTLLPDDCSCFIACNFSCRANLFSSFLGGDFGSFLFRLPFLVLNAAC